MYDVLEIRYHKDGYDNKGNQMFNVSWRSVGVANSMEDARKFSRYPVLAKRVKPLTNGK